MFLRFLQFRLESSILPFGRLPSSVIGTLEMSHASRGVSSDHKAQTSETPDTALADKADAASGALKWPEFLELPSWVANAVGLKEAHPAKYHYGPVAPPCPNTLQHRTTGTCLSLCLKSWHPSLRKRKSKNSSPLEMTSQSLYSR